MTVDLDELPARQATIDRLLMAEGAGHVVHDLPVRADGRSVALASRPWRLDPIPYRIAAADFLWLEEAVRRRMAMIETILDDVYGDRRLVADGLLDPALLWGSQRYRLAAVSSTHGRRQRRWLSTYAVDVARTADGVWFAIADHTDAPAGLGYALLDRLVVSEALGARDLVDVRPLAPILTSLRRSLAESTETVGPRIAVFTAGIDHPAYVEHSYLATSLGFNLVEGADLVVRDRHLWLQTLGGLERIDVVHRKMSDRELDPMETNATGSFGVPGVLLAAESGHLAMANAHGTGVAEDPVLAQHWDRSGVALTGDEPWLTLAPGASVLTERGVTPELDDHSGTLRGIDAVLGRAAERVDVWFDGRVQELPLVLRFHAIATDDGIVVLPGANGRVITETDDPRLPTPCLAKDVWVARDPAAASAPAVVAALPASMPQVDLIASVPTRAADSLYWLSRAAERAEAVARTCRVVAARVADADPAPIVDDPRSVALQLLDALAGPAIALASVDPPPTAADHDDVTGAERDAIVASAQASLVYHVGSMLAEAAGVREFLSTTTGRVLGELADTRDRLAVRVLDVDALDTLLLQLSAFAGLWSESVVRGPAWYYGDFARRYERTTVALVGAATAVRCATDPSRPDHARRTGLESVLAANDSLVAYRRRHRSDVELDAVLRLLIADERNPRSAAASLLGLDRNARSIGWEEGVEGIGRLRARLESVAATTAPAPSALEALVTDLHDVASRLHDAKLTAPPHPTLIRAGDVVDPGAVA